MKFAKVLEKLTKPSFLSYFKKKPSSPFPGIPLYHSEHNAFELRYDQYGDPEKVLSGQFVPIDKPGQHEVRLQMLAAPVNHTDLYIIQGKYFVKHNLPARGGNEGVGQVVSVGPGVETLVKGDWVIPRDHGWGTWRTQATSDEGDLVRVPRTIPLLGAATMALHPATAYRLLTGFVKLKPGDAIIQNGANSFVGNAVIQLCKEWGVTTINIVRNRYDIESRNKYLRELGADHIVMDKYLVSEDMKFFCNSLPKRPRLALDCIGGRMMEEIPPYLSEDGLVVTYGRLAVDDDEPPVWDTDQYPLQTAKVRGYWESTWDHENAPVSGMTEICGDLCEMMRRGAFRPPYCEIIPMGESYQQAIRAAKEDSRRSKVVMQIHSELS